jgi:hypothetical protein
MDDFIGIGPLVAGEMGPGTIMDTVSKRDFARIQVAKNHRSRSRCDFGLDPDGMLVISRRAYAVIKAHGLRHADAGSPPNHGLD